MIISKKEIDVHIFHTDAWVAYIPITNKLLLLIFIYSTLLTTKSGPKRP